MLAVNLVLWNERILMRSVFIGLTILFLVLGGCLQVNAENDFQTWQWMIFHLTKGERFKSHIYADNRIADNSRREKTVIIGPRLQYEVNDSVQVGVGYLFLDIHDLNRDIWQKEHRFENELNFKYKFGGKWKFHNRNRFESRLRESQNGWKFRTRSRFEIRYQLNMGRLKSVYTNNELFWDHDMNQVGENRLVPVGFQFDLSDRCDLTLFYMIQSIRQFNPSGWNQNHILGTHMNFRF